MTEPIHASRPIKIKPLTRNTEQRVCDHPGCGTRLNGYNRVNLCYVHTPKKMPRSPRGTVA